MAPDILYAMGREGFITYYIFMMAFVAGFMLLALTGLHGKIISGGQTSVEHLVGQSPTERYSTRNSIFHRIFNKNLIDNWKKFLGVRTVDEFILRILFPSTHKPAGNGVTTEDNLYDANVLVERDRFLDKTNSSYIWKILTTIYNYGFVRIYRTVLSSKKEPLKSSYLLPKCKYQELSMQRTRVIENC